MSGNDARTVVLIGSSTGGPRTLEGIFSRFPSVNAAIIIVQHMPSHINRALSDRLGATCQMDVKLAKDGEPLRHGTIYVAPSERHLSIVDNRTIRLFDDERVQFVKPSIDVAMKSTVKRPGDTIVGVVLTGMGRDGAEGIRHIKSLGGITIAQSLKTCIIHEMPRAAFETGKVDFVLPPEGIREKLIRISGQGDSTPVAR